MESQNNEELVKQVEHKGFTIEQFNTVNRRSGNVDGTRIVVSHPNLKSANLYVREKDFWKCAELGKHVADGLLEVLAMNIQGVQ